MLQEFKICYKHRGYPCFCKIKAPNRTIAEFNLRKIVTDIEILEDIIPKVTRYPVVQKPEIKIVEPSIFNKMLDTFTLKTFEFTIERTKDQSVITFKDKKSSEIVATYIDRDWRLERGMMNMFPNSIKIYEWENRKKIIDKINVLYEQSTARYTKDQVCVKFPRAVDESLRGLVAKCINVAHATGAEIDRHYKFMAEYQSQPVRFSIKYDNEMLLLYENDKQNNITVITPFNLDPMSKQPSIVAYRQTDGQWNWSKEFRDFRTLIETRINQCRIDTTIAAAKKKYGEHVVYKLMLKTWE